MARQGTRRIERELLDEPHVSGRRVSVRQIHGLVTGRDTDPESVADRYDLDVADVYHALAYYHDHPREMSAVEAARDADAETLRKAIDRPEDVEADSG